MQIANTTWLCIGSGNIEFGGVSWTHWFTEIRFPVTLSVNLSLIIAPTLFVYYVLACACIVVHLCLACRLYEFKDIIESEVIDIEKLRKLTFRGLFVDPVSCLHIIDLTSSFTYFSLAYR